jgi:hypothetical protein
MKPGVIGPCEKKYGPKREARESQRIPFGFDISSNRNEIPDGNLILLRRSTQENDNLKARLRQVLGYMKTNTAYNA